MAVARLRNYRNYLCDGKSWTEAQCSNKKQVLVALLGVEPLVVKKDEDFLDIDDVILKMAKNIQRVRAAKKKKKVSNASHPTSRRK